ncbi:hypothetical protein FB554_0671 [Barrientosiimonas humi]|uniref:FHA domain-containing protein n=1 Tax=Barrientosiimonas humi TaxID=999931 RepID=A0A542X9N5_9MICO|nr:hypothetical protein [Barrientosiimonas humi]TQL32545.1 hypothetical protein FB554_0671 [Barrientosiimonas humi]
MTIGLVVLRRDGGQEELPLREGETLVFGRAGHEGTVVVSTSSRVSRSAFELRAETGGLVHVRCQQRQGTLEVKRADGRVAGSLEDGEEATFRPPVQLLLHTSTGAQATVVVNPDRQQHLPRSGGAAPGAAGASGAPAAADPASTVTTGWNVASIQSPPAGQDWQVAAALAAVLLRRGRMKDPSYTVPRGVLLRTCGQWLGAAKSEGWLASKFRQASEALAVPFGSNPSQQLGEYVLANHLLTEGGLRALDAELDRRRSGGPPARAVSAPLPRR